MMRKAIKEKTFKKLWHNYIVGLFIAGLFAPSFVFGYGIINTEVSSATEMAKTLITISLKKTQIKSEIDDFKKELETQRDCLKDEIKYLSAVVALTRATLINRKDELAQLKDNKGVLSTDTIQKTQGTENGKN